MSWNTPGTSSYPRNKVNQFDPLAKERQEIIEARNLLDQEIRARAVALEKQKLDIELKSEKEKLQSELRGLQLQRAEILVP